MPQVVLITGCSTGGIGYSLCEEFASRGCKVYATSRRVDTIQDFENPLIERISLDVTQDADVQKVVQKIMDAEGGIDIVVNNAGVMCAGPLLDQSIEYARKVFDTNTFATLRVAQAVVPFMVKRRAGVLVNIGSVVGEIPTPWNGIYCASKAALQSISEVLWMECKPFDIHVLHVSPGSVTSNISANQTSRFDLPAGSIYKAFLPNIIQRINASQGPHAMPTREFARRVVTGAMQKKPPRYMTLGGNSATFSFFKWLPRVWGLLILWRVYSKKLQ
ncbi:oxidoreductase [Infundibulicybe gibba]|nr:oxidoreductase [Infundibulicybe gibba]